MRGAPRLLVLFLVFLGTLFLPAGPASAHAALVGATPSPGSIIGSSPTEIVIVFSEAVTPVSGHVQVVAPDGKRISGTPTVSGDTLRIPVRKADQPLGTYLVSYRVISADTHPVGGAVTFSVGAPSTAPAAPADTGTARSVAVAIPVLHFLSYAGLVLSVGPALFLALLWPRSRSRRGAVITVFSGLGTLFAATLGSLWTQAPAGSGAQLWDSSFTELGQVFASYFGLVLLSRLALVAIAAGLVLPVIRGGSTRTRQSALVLVTLAGFVTWPLSGHASASPLSGVIVAADVVHIASMAVWLGGLVTLSAFLLRGTHTRVLSVVLPVWSRWAALAVVWLVAGGAVQAVVQVGSVSAVLHTTYGRLVLAKIAILAVTLSFAWYARRLITRLSVTRMRLSVGAEVLATVAILGVSAVLVQVNPGRSATVDQGAVRNDGVSQTLTSKLYTLQFNIYPVEIGENNTIHAFVYTPSGAPLPAEEWTVTDRLLGSADLEPVSQPLLPLIPRNHAAGAITFPLPGTYEIKFTVRTTDIDEATVTTQVTVAANAPD